jgi:hypothetical protein
MRTRFSIVALQDSQKTPTLTNQRVGHPATNFGSAQNKYPLHPQALLDFMKALQKEGIPASDIDLMAKTNPALVLGLQP